MMLNAKREDTLRLLRKTQERLFPSSEAINGLGTTRKYKMDEGTCIAVDLYTDPDGRFQVTWWQNPKGTKFPEHEHGETECIVVIKGQILISYSSGDKVLIKPTEGVCNILGKKHEAFFPEDTEYLTWMVPATDYYPEAHAE